MGTHYDNLKVAENAPDEVIRAAYRALSLRYHPDKNPGNAESNRIMQIINDSYSTLSDPTRRRQYDMSLAFDRQARPTATQPAQHTTKKPTYNHQPPGRRGWWKTLSLIFLLDYRITLGAFVLVWIGIASLVDKKPPAVVVASQPQAEQLPTPKPDRPRSTRSQDVKLGMTKAEVVAARGKAAVVSEDVWRYELFEITFQNDRVISWEARLFPAPPPFLEPELPTPAAGEVIADTNRERVAPLEIRSSGGTGNYLLLLRQ